MVEKWAESRQREFGSTYFFRRPFGEHLVLAVNLPRNARTPVKANMIEPDMTQLAWTRTRQNEEHWILGKPG